MINQRNIISVMFPAVWSIFRTEEQSLIEPTSNNSLLCHKEQIALQTRFRRLFVRKRFGYHSKIKSKLENFMKVFASLKRCVLVTASPEDRLNRS